MAQIGSLSVKLGLVTVEWDQATAKAKQQAKDLQASFDSLGSSVDKLNGYWKALGGAISVGSLGMAALIEQTVEFTDKIRHLSEGFDLTTSQTLAFRSALMGAGVNADGASRIMSTLFSKIQEGRQGTDAVLGQFEKLGITFQDLQKMSPYEAIQRVAQGFSNVSNQFEKVKLIKEFFGRAGVGVDIEEIAKALEAGTGKFDKYGDSIEKVGKIADNIKANFENLKVAFADLAAPFARDKIISIEKFEAILVSIGSATVAAGIASTVVELVKIVQVLREAEVAITAINIAAAFGTPTGMIIKGASLLAGATAYFYMMGKAANDAVPEIEKLQNRLNDINDMLAKNPNANFRAVDALKAEAIQIQAKIGELKAAGGGSPEANANSGNKKADAMSKEATALSAQVELQRQLLKLEKDKATLALQENTLGASLVKIGTIEIQLKEDLAKIEAKRVADLQRNKEGTQAMLGEVNALANAEAQAARNRAAAQVKEIQYQEEYKRILAERENSGDFMRSEKAGYATSSATATGQAEALQAQRFAVNQQTNEQTRLGELANERLKYEQSIINLMPLEQQYLLEKYDLEAKITEFKYQQNKLGEDPEVINRQVEQLKKVGQATIELNKQTTDYKQTVEYGLTEAYNNVMEKATNMATLAGNSFNSVISNMDSALTKFVQTGKINFKDLVGTILKGLIQIQLQAQVNRAIGGPLMSALSLLLGGSPGVPSSSFGNGGAYADGGEPPVGKVSLVGEQGPELFIPKTAGTIVPNGALGGLGSTTNVTNNYIQAIDTQSFEQRLYGSSQAIWAANQYATKNLATNRART